MYGLGPALIIMNFILPAVGLILLWAMIVRGMKKEENKNRFNVFLIGFFIIVVIFIGLYIRAIGK